MLFFKYPGFITFLKKFFVSVTQKLGRKKFPSQTCSCYGKNKTTYVKFQILLAKTNGEFFYCLHVNQNCHPPRPYSESYQHLRWNVFSKYLTAKIFAKQSILDVFQDSKYVFCLFFFFSMYVLRKDYGCCGKLCKFLEEDLQMISLVFAWIAGSELLQNNIVMCFVLKLLFA